MDFISEAESHFYINKSLYFITLLVFSAIISAVYAIFVDPIPAILFFIAIYFIVPILLTWHYKDKYDYDTVIEISGFSMGYAHMFNSIIAISVSVALSNIIITFASLFWFFIGYSVSIFVGISLSAILLSIFGK